MATSSLAAGVYLASPVADFRNGVNIHMDGGCTANISWTSTHVRGSSVPIPKSVGW